MLPNIPLYGRRPLHDAALPGVAQRLGGVIGALSTTLSRLNSDGSVDLNITSAAAGVTKHFEDTAHIQQGVINDRVWSGIHFHTSDVVGVEIGVQVRNWALEHYFAPTKS